MRELVKTTWMVILFIIGSCKIVHASTKSFILQIYLKRIEQMIESNEFSEAKRSLILLEAMFPTDKDVQEKSKELVIKDYKETYLKNIECSEEELAWTGDIKKCKPGKVSSIAIEKSLAILKYFRRLAGISDKCVFVDSFNIYCQHAAYVLYVNDLFTHDIEKSVKCYTELAEKAARQSNISRGSIGPLAIQSQMFDNGKYNYGVCHRRWILNPFNTKFGIGMTPYITVLGVFGKFCERNEAENREFAEGKQYVAWPSAGYFPTRLVPLRWSFSLEDASFKEAKVNVYEIKNGKKVPIEIKIEPIEEGCGLNTLVWEPKNEWDVANESVFEVEIKNVYMESFWGIPMKDKSYSFSYKIITLEI